ncbi:hypothetical protein PMAYCL1PPCAC_00221, partial [Pristionchus mayeri]
ECWLQHVQLSMREGRGAAGCMDVNCSLILTPDAATSLLSPESVVIYRKCVEEITLFEKKTLRCPHCAKDVLRSGSRSAICGCGTVICSTCEAGDHWPVFCSVYLKYRAARDGKEDVADDLWFPMLNNLSKCPKCGNYVMKNGGQKVRLIDVAPPPPPDPILPSIISSTLAARKTIEERRKEIEKRLEAIGKAASVEVLKAINKLVHLLELALLSSKRAKSRQAASSIRLAFFAFANT